MVQLWADRRLEPAFTEPWIQAKVIGGDKRAGKARPIASEEMLLKMVTSSILRAHVSQVRRAAGAYQFGIYLEGGGLEIAGKIHAKMAAEPTKVFIACDIKNGFGAVRRSDAIEGAPFWEQSLPTSGLENKVCNRQRGQALQEVTGRSQSEMDSCKVRARRQSPSRWH